MSLLNQKTMLTRPGNKSSLAHIIYSHFPVHKMRIELFFGAGGAYLNMPKPKYAVLNDADDDVVNLYEVLIDHKEELRAAIEILPISSTLVHKWKRIRFEDPIKKAVRFLLLSNFTYLGKGDTLRLGLYNSKKSLLLSIDETFLALKDAKISGYDFRKVLPKISFSKGLCTKQDAFIYMDPIYHETEHFYKVTEWTWTDTLDCFGIMTDSGIRTAMSEFDHPDILREANKRNLTIIPIKERQNIKNRRTEILILNYQNLSLFN